MTRIIIKTKALALLSIIVAVTVFGAFVYSAYATEDGTTKHEKILPFRGLPNDLLERLTEEQQGTLQGMMEENHAEMEANRDEIEAQLEEWGIEIPEKPQHTVDFLEDLTEEQKEELETMRQEFRDSVNSKLEEWGIEVPEFDDTGLRRCPERFDLVKP